jgi:hypothetical protein
LPFQVLHDADCIPASYERPARRQRILGSDMTPDQLKEKFDIGKMGRDGVHM